MLKGTTKTGFNFELNEEDLNDYELFELIAGVGENQFLLPKLVTKLLGEEQKKRLLEHVRTPDGRVPMTVIDKEITDIFSLSKEIKNS